MSTTNKKKLTHSRSLLYESEQRIITQSLDKLYECVSDKVYLSLKSNEEVAAMKRRSLTHSLSGESHGYMSVNDKYVEESYEGIREKMKINGRHRESGLLQSLWSELVATDRRVPNRSECSVHHAMIKLLLHLSTTPTQAGKHSNVHNMMMSEDMTSDETSSEKGEGNSSDDNSSDEELEYASIEEDRRLWMNSFSNECGDSDTDEEYWGDHDDNTSESSISHPLTSLPHDEPHSHTQPIVCSDDTTSLTLDDPLFIADGGDLPYGAHISTYSHHHITRCPPAGTHTPYSLHTGTSDGCEYSTALVAPLPLVSSSVHSSGEELGVICMESDVCIMVTEMMLGYSSDFFQLSPLTAIPSSGVCVHPAISSERSFSFTHTGNHSRLVNISSTTLRNLLQWFVTLSNEIYVVRNYANVDFGSQRRDHSKESVGSEQLFNNQIHHPTGFSEVIQTSVQQELRDLLKSLDAVVTKWQRQLVPNSSLSSEQTLDESDMQITLVRMYVLLNKKWAKAIGMAARLTSSVVDLDFVQCEASSITSEIDEPVSHAPHHDGDLFQHEHVVAVLEQLKRDCNSLHLVHCHPQLALLATTAADETFEGVRQLRLEFCDSRQGTNFIRNSFFSLQSTYLNYMINWLHSSAGQGSSRARRIPSASDSELRGGLAGLHPTERVSKLRPILDNNNESIHHMQSSRSMSDIFLPDSHMRDILDQIFSCISDVRILKKYHHSLRSDHAKSERGNISNRTSFDTRDFLTSVSKGHHAILSLYSDVSSQSSRCGLIPLGTCYDGLANFILAPNDLTKRRLMRRKQHPIESSGQRTDVEVLESEVTNDTVCVTRNDETSIWNLESLNTRKYGGRLDITSAFSSHKRLMYQNDVLKQNSLSLRQLYTHKKLESNVISQNETILEVFSSGISKSKTSTCDICLPMLIDIFPSSVSISDLVLVKPLRETLDCTQQVSVSVLQERFYIFDHFSFLQNVFLLGDVSTVFASLRESLFDRGNIGGSSFGARGYQYQEQHQLDILLGSLSDSIMLRICNALPSNFSESLVSVTFSATGSNESDHEKQNNGIKASSRSGDGNESRPSAAPYANSVAERLYLSLNNLVIQMHYPSPLSEILCPDSVATYNLHLRFLLKVTLCCWTSEKLWKEATGSGSYLTQLCTTRRSVENPNAGSLRQLHRSCMMGLQWIIYVSRALESFYLHEIHNVQCVKFRESLHQTISGSSLQEGGSKISIQTLAESHDIYLNRISSSVHFLQSTVLRATRESISALGVFGEAHVAAEGNKALFSHSFNDNGRGPSRENNDTAVVKIVLSRLTHAASKMKQAQSTIVELVDVVERMYQHQQDLSVDDTRHVIALRSLLGHISNADIID